ncbi:hypothetical protein CYMTET_39149 [Cymbomonas tetramitiformis]|uniref:Uncharacterized protein n=1 Tax=Cymbomonas tetramitiformis TaxID=36881 RepID=A0AAE0CC31_9CHLO|nr:hypothetical protein CYMTET_39149 [Cymbomonas tetramitiformis]
MARADGAQGTWEGHAGVQLLSIEEHIQRRKRRTTLWTAAPINNEASRLEHPDRQKMTASSSAADRAMASMAMGNWRLQMRLAEQEKLLQTTAEEKASLEHTVARLCVARFQGAARDALQRKSHCQEMDGVRADLEATVYANQREREELRTEHASGLDKLRTEHASGLDKLRSDHVSSAQKAHSRLQMKENMVQQMLEAVRTHKQDAKDLREQLAKQSEALSGQQVDVRKVHEELSAANREKEDAASNIAKAEEARKEVEEAKKEAEQQAVEYRRKVIAAERATELLQADLKEAKAEAEQARHEAETASGALKLQLAELQKKLAAIKQESDLDECESRTPNHQKSPRLSPRGSSRTPPPSWRRSPPPEEASPTDGKPRWNPSCPDLNRSKCARSKLMPALVTLKSTVEIQADLRPIPKH